jgi:hypothetical protein
MLFLGTAVRLSPWFLVHLVALPLAVRGCFRRAREPAALLAALYLGWLLQALLLQQIFDYVQTPPVLLGLALVLVEGSPPLRGGVLTYPPRSGGRLLPRLALVAWLLWCVVFRFPGILATHVEMWPQCLREGSTPALRDRLARHPWGPSWRDLAAVEGFLRTQDVRDGELTCFNNRTTPLYLDLGVRPSMRYFFLEMAFIIFKSHRAEIKADIAASRQRYVVYDLRQLPSEDQLEPDAPDWWQRDRDLPFRQYPAWKDRIVFHAGRYVVLAIPAAEMPRWVEESFGY